MVGLLFKAFGAVRLKLSPKYYVSALTHLDPCIMIQHPKTVCIFLGFQKDMPCGSFKIFSLFLLCYKKAVPGTSPLIDTSHAAVSPPKKTKCWVVICQLFLIARSSINILANHTISFGKTSDVNLDPHSFSLLDPDPDPDTG